MSTASTVFEIPLPSGKLISFRLPTYRDRQAAVKRFRQQQNEVGWSIEEFLAFGMLEFVDGVPMQAGLDPIDQVSEWSLKDVNIYLEVFMPLVFPDDVAKQRAQDMVKALLEGKSVVKQAASPITSAPTTVITA
jgi:hypothetical protein